LPDRERRCRLDTVVKRRRGRKKVEEAVDYRFRPTAWWSNHSAWQYQWPRSDEAEHYGSVDVDFEVELLEPMKGVRRGRLEVTSEPDQTRWGHVLLSYYTSEGSEERILSATAWTSDVGVLALLMLLIGGRAVELTAHGPPFKYGQAFARSFGWHTADHPDREDM
jgi:hypothetical protein